MIAAGPRCHPESPWLFCAKAGAPSFALSAKGGSRSSYHLYLLDHINSKQNSSSFEVERVTAPRPLSRILHQRTFHRVQVHVVNLLAALFLAPNVEIVKSSLPKMGQFQRQDSCLQ